MPWASNRDIQPLALRPAQEITPVPVPTGLTAIAASAVPAERGPDLGADVPATPAKDVLLTPDKPRPRLQQAAVHQLLAPGVQACRTEEWLALKLRVAGGVGHVTTINGFAPDALDPDGIEKCVMTAVRTTRFPSASPATFTLRFEPDR